MKVKFKRKNVEVSTEFNWNKTPKQINKDLGLNPQLDLFAANTAYKLMNDFVPMQSGALSRLVNIYAKDNEGYVHYMAPYAHYQYNGIGFDFNIEKHPLATSRWDKAMMTARKEQYIKTIDNYRKRLAK